VTIWAHLEPLVRAKQPKRKLPPISDKGWYNQLHSPLRPDKHPSFAIKPDDGNGDLGAFIDHGTGDKGTLKRLAELMGVSLDDAPMPKRWVTVFEWCGRRGFSWESISGKFGLTYTWDKKRGDFIVIPTPGRTRLRYCDGAHPKTKWGKVWGEDKSSTRIVYGLDQCKGDEPIYIVNGEPGVWACHEAGVDAVCFCQAETTPPSSVQAKPLIETKRPLRIVYDLDDAGERGAEICAHALRGFGAQDVQVLSLPEHLGEKGDIEDWWREVGDELATRLISLEQGKPVVEQGAAREVFVRSEDPVRVVDDACDALAAYAEERNLSLYQRAGQIVRAQVDEIQALSRHCLFTHLGTAAKWLHPRKTEKGVNWHAKLPPEWAVKAVHSRGTYPLPHITQILLAPAMLPSGELLIAPGLSEGFLLRSDLQTQVPTHPSREDALTASQALLEVVADFPFAEPCHRSAWLALVLAGLARPAIQGPCPFFVFDANVRGAGKSLLARAAQWILTGQDLPMTSAPQREEEWSKKVLATLRAGRPLFIFDNVKGKVTSQALEAVLTAHEWQDRVLGASDLGRLPAKTIWVMTSNNARLGGDLNRRSLHCQLRSDMECPELREDFGHPDLKAYVLERRAQLVSAGLTILRSWVLSKTAPPSPSWGSFEEFSRIVRGAVTWCGLADPYQSKTLEDEGVETLRTLLALWPEDEQDRPLRLSATKIVKLVTDSSAPWAEAVKEIAGTDQPSVRVVGNRFRVLRGRYLGGRCLQMEMGRARERLWFVQSHPESPPESP
jgi:hypothetical protein